MNNKIELVKNTLIIMFGKICTQFVSFLLLPLYTNMLSTSDYGFVDLITTYIFLFVPVITLQLESALFRFLIDSRNDEEAQKEVFSNTFFLVFKFIILFLILYFLICQFFNIPYKFILLFCILSTIFSNLFLQASRGLGDNIGYSLGSIIAGVGTVVFNVVFIVALKMSAYGILLSMFIANTLCAIFLFMREKVYKYIRISKVDKNLKQSLLKYSLPLVINGIIWWVINVSDRTIISIFLGTAANGIYAIAYKISNVLIGLYGVFNLSWTETAALHIKDKDSEEFFCSVFNKLLVFSTIVCALIISILPFVFNFIIGENFKEAYYYIPFLIIGSYFNIIVMFIGSIYIALKNTKEVSKTSILSGLINIIFNLLLIKIIGIWAAVISTIIAFLSMSIYRYFDVKKYINIHVKAKTIVSIVIAFCLCITLYYGLNI